MKKIYNYDYYYSLDRIIEGTVSEISLPKSGINIISDYLFYDCKNLTDITIPNTITYIGEYSFSKSGLKSILIPDTVESIGRGAFIWCDDLLSIECGAIYISWGAFQRCSKLRSANFSDSVKTIGNDAFADCSYLSNVSIGSGIESIGTAAFWYCNSLTTINYNGTRADWSKVKYDDAFNAPITIRCKDGNVKIN